jgi:hypothetical protein
VNLVLGLEIMTVGVEGDPSLAALLVWMGNLDLHDKLQIIIDSIQAGRYSEHIVFPCSLVSQRNIISTQSTYRMQTRRLSCDFG